MELNVSHEDGYVLAVTTGPIDESAKPLFAEYLHPLVGERGTNVVIDLSQSNFITSNGIGQLVSLATHANTNGSHVVLAACSPFIALTLDRCKLNRFFDMARTVPEAIGHALDRIAPVRRRVVRWANRGFFASHEVSRVLREGLARLQDEAALRQRGVAGLAHRRGGAEDRAVQPVPVLLQGVGDRRRTDVPDVSRQAIDDLAADARLLQLHGCQSDHAGACLVRHDEIHLLGADVGRLEGLDRGSGHRPGAPSPSPIMSRENTNRFGSIVRPPPGLGTSTFSRKW